VTDAITREHVLKRNSTERLKLEKSPLDIIEELPAFAVRGYESVAEEDIVRLKWYGLYHDKPKTGYFMLRVKTPGGLLTPALMDAGWRAVALTAPEYRLAEVSRTFHGRDVFAPAAAYLAAGVPLERLGPAVTDPVRRPIPRSRLEDGTLIGEVLAVDRFGNLLTSIEAAQLVGLPGGRPGAVPVKVPVIVEVADRAVAGPVEAYLDGGDGRPTAIVGSTGRLEIFVRGARADQALGVGRGAPVRVRAGEG